MKIIDPKVQFASRFSPEDWQSLCANPKFIDVVERGAFDEAEVVAWIALNDEINSNAAMASVQIALNGEKLHSAACDFVRIWASKTGRSGRDGKQSRQNHIRKLVKHGMNSDYFRSMAKEAGMV